MVNRNPTFAKEIVFVSTKSDNKTQTDFIFRRRERKDPQFRFLLFLVVVEPLSFQAVLWVPCLLHYKGWIVFLKIWFGSWIVYYWAAAPPSKKKNKNPTWKLECRFPNALGWCYAFKDVTSIVKDVLLLSVRPSEQMRWATTFLTSQYCENCPFTLSVFLFSNQLLIYKRICPSIICLFFQRSLGGTMSNTFLNIQISMDVQLSMDNQYQRVHSYPHACWPFQITLKLCRASIRLGNNQ